MMSSGSSLRPAAGSTLLMAMLVVGILFVSGIGFLSQQRHKYEAAARAARAIEAMALAEAGLEDARMKMQLDWDFPPRAAFDQNQFSYAETVLDADGVQVGSYEVTIDRSSLGMPQRVLLVRSTGRVVSSGEILAQRRLSKEIDLDPSRPAFFRPLSWRDEGSL